MPEITTSTTSNTEEESIQEYMNSLNDIQKQACIIAREHLETSFDIVKSNGYKAWIQKKEK